LSDLEQRLREKTQTILRLNQQVEQLSGQISGLTKRLQQKDEEIEHLKSLIAERDQKISKLQNDILGYEEVIRRLNQRVEEATSEASASSTESAPAEVSRPLVTKEEIDELKNQIKELSDKITTITKIATKLILEPEEGKNELIEYLLKQGDPKYRILLAVTKSESEKVSNLDKITNIPPLEVQVYVKELVNENELEQIDPNTVMIGAKLREVSVPEEKWRKLSVDELFDEFIKYAKRVKNKDLIASAIEILVAILEEHLSRPGVLIFQMRRAADTWRRSGGDLQELEYTARDWKARAKSLM